MNKKRVSRASTGLSSRKIASLRRRSSKQLYLSLASREASEWRAAHYVPQIHASRERTGPVRHRKSGQVAFMSRGVDGEMLTVLHGALRGHPTVDAGKAIVKTAWQRIRQKVCEEWDLCAKTGIGDAGLILALVNFLSGGVGSVDGKSAAVIAVLLVRLGPDWMCGCSKKRAKPS